MLYNNFIEKLIDLQGAEVKNNVKNIENTDTSINIFLIKQTSDSNMLPPAYLFHFGFCPNY